MTDAVVRQSGADEVTVLAPAKINLFLEVIGRRPDGFHELASLMQKLPLCDVLHVRRQQGGVSLSCPDSDLPEDGSNLVYQAAERFLSRFVPTGAGVTLRLEKHIPIAAGLGGGSSDAAAALLALRHVFSPALPDAPLLELARGLGADVAFFVAPYEAAWATGRGDILAEARPLRGYGVVLVNPGFSVATRWVYESFSLTEKGCSNKVLNFVYDSVGGENPYARQAISPAALRNDLEPVTAGLHAEIGLMRQALLDCGAEAVLMSGSGPTVFGLFRDNRQVDDCRERLARRFRTVIALPSGGGTEKMGWGVVKR
ncbi:MAG: 4-(cytidine 5'-diphospho)-2-C-methyl-D-erythritol kinase [Desulfobulbaceae bacterium A2]|nr:MAG: 4-(cytidine 5'-diphospho)-2-C-methyl-D-erythritol kinase [Desulfobulbaceae bacterium A2]